MHDDITRTDVNYQFIRLWELRAIFSERPVKNMRKQVNVRFFDICHFLEVRFEDSPIELG
jgi:hypothetical protein